MGEAQYKNFNIQRSGPVLSLVLATQCKGNSYNALFWEELSQFLRLIKDDHSIRVLTLSAEGRHFGGGMNVEYLASLNKTKGDDPARYNYWIKEKVLYLQAVIAQFEALPFPVIGAASGACIGGSMALFAACDLRIADTSALFSIHEINVGIMCDLGTIQRVSTLCGHAFGSYLAYSGDTIDAHQALAASLISKCCDNRDSLDEHLTQLAHKVAGHSPLALAGIKNTLRSYRDMRFSDSLQLSAVWNAGMYTSADVSCAIQAQQERRTIQFGDLYGDCTDAD